MIEIKNEKNKLWQKNCRRRDLNPYGVAPNRFWVYRVYQFHHAGSQGENYNILGSFCKAGYKLIFVSDILAPIMDISFRDLGLDESVLNAVAAKGF